MVEPVFQRVVDLHPVPEEVLQRLLKLYHERYAEEVAKGLYDKKKPKASKKKAKDDTSPMLFGEEDDGEL